MAGALYGLLITSPKSMSEMEMFATVTNAMSYTAVPSQAIPPKTTAPGTRD